MRASAAAMARAAESQGHGIKGVVRITASEIIGAEVLPPIITRLQRQWPELRVELALSNQVQDLLVREADIAVRMTPPKQESLIARNVGNIELGFHAHQAYLQDRGTPRTLADLADHALIGFDEETPFLRAASKALPAWGRDNFALRSDSDLAQLAMIRAGAGIGICQITLAKRDPNLVHLLAEHFVFKLDTWLAMHEDLRHSPRCKVTFDALLEGLQHYVS
ncbi:MULTISPECIES: LysR substrate-binding domain-containing protein [unclassified Pseudomonas]|nr:MULTISPECIES: LysR substrate-binding domain-containing protein [unclassified Pseudomonas]WPX26108.1 LysR substrate-binding domain-containing protein [Pseudomonas sp. AH2]